MTEPSPPPEQEQAPEKVEEPPKPAKSLGPAAATLSAFSVLSLVSGIVVATRPLGQLPRLHARLVVFFTMGHVLLLGSAAALIVALWARFGPKRRVFATLAIALLAAACGVVVLEDDAAGVAERLSQIAALPFSFTLVAISIGLAMSIPAAFALGRALARRWIRLVVAAFCVAIVWANGLLLPGTYEGAHLFAFLAAAVLFAASLVDAPLPARLAKAPRWAFRVPSGLVASFGVLSLVLIPPDVTHVAMLGQPAAVLAPYALLVVDAGGDSWEPSEAERPWFESREKTPPITPSEARILPPSPIVLVISIDSLRADILADEARRPKLPGLFQIRDESAYFTEARSAGSSTAPALAAMFSCVHYSQQYWSRHPKSPGDPYPHLDPKPRFPELLSAAGIQTVTVDSAGWLINEFGIVRGFAEEKTVRVGRDYPSARTVLEPVIERIRNHQGGPLFVFAHLLDAHSPYDRALKTGPIVDRYVGELGLVDLEIRRMRNDLVRTGLWPRTMLVIMSDHGEAFSEHGMTFHGQTLYDELLRIPLLFRVPNKPPHRFSEPVSLIDLGPTILDAYGVQTPGHCMGQSLVPLLAGGKTQLTRPIVAEARLKRAIVTTDGKKIIHDTRSRSVELYDLKKDPKEENNVYDEDSAEAVEMLGRVKRFFAAHTLKKPGYKVPFRRW